MNLDKMLMFDLHIHAIIGHIGLQLVYMFRLQIVLILSWVGELGNRRMRGDVYGPWAAPVFHCIKLFLILTTSCNSTAPHILDHCYFI